MQVINDPYGKGSGGGFGNILGTGIGGGFASGLQKLMDHKLNEKIKHHEVSQLEKAFEKTGTLKPGQSTLLALIAHKDPRAAYEMLNIMGSPDQEQQPTQQPDQTQPIQEPMQQQAQQNPLHQLLAHINQQSPGQFAQMQLNGAMNQYGAPSMQAPAMPAQQQQRPNVEQLPTKALAPLKKVRESFKNIAKRQAQEQQQKHYDQQQANFEKSEARKQRESEHRMSKVDKTKDESNEYKILKSHGFNDDEIETILKSDKLDLEGAEMFLNHFHNDIGKAREFAKKVGIKL